MTRPVRIPAEHREAIRRLAQMDDAQFEALLIALSTDVGSLGPSRLAGAVSAQLSWDGLEARVTVDALLGALSVQQRRRTSTETMAGLIADEATLDLSDAERPVLVARMTRLLGIEPLATLSRAFQLLAEDERTYCRARSLSDLRPVFRIGSEPPEEAGVIIHHTLEIRYHEDGDEAKGFYLTVTDATLQNLRSVIERALAKGQSLKKMAETSGLRIIDVEENH